MARALDPGRGWVYEHIVSAIPGASLSTRWAIALQFLGFEAVVLGLVWLYELPQAAALAGTAAVIVATAGSAAMVAVGSAVREADPSPGYERMLFGSNIEVVLGVVSYAALSTYFLVGWTGQEPGLLQDVLGASPPAPAVFVAFLLAWDVCYRIGVGWWASLVGCWRSLRGHYAPGSTAALRRADGLTIGFAVVQLVLVPVVAREPLLALAILGHVAAVVAVSGASLAALRWRKISRPGSP